MIKKGRNLLLFLLPFLAISSIKAQETSSVFMSINLNYMTYLADSKVGSASFVKVFSVRHTIGITGQLFNYGKMDETDADGNKLGSFSPNDMAISALYSYTMGNGLVGGAALRFISSTYGDYSSSAIGVDLGLHYFKEEKNFSAGLVLKNIGRQLSSFHEDRTEHLQKRRSGSRLH